MQLSGPASGLLLLALAACTAARPAPRPAVEAPVAFANPAPGFSEKEPDTCKAAGLQGLVGQPSGMARTVRAPGPMRIISPASVYDQEEYRSDRINLFIDDEGVIRRISCG